MKRFLSWLIGAPAALLLVLLSVANRGPVTFSLDPFSIGSPSVAFELPLYLLLFGALFIGLLVGWMVGWSGQARWRREARLSRRAAPSESPGGGSGQALLPRP